MYIEMWSFSFESGKLPWAGSPLNGARQSGSIGGRFKEFQLYVVCCTTSETIQDVSCTVDADRAVTRTASVQYAIELINGQTNRCSIFFRVVWFVIGCALNYLRDNEIRGSRLIRLHSNAPIYKYSSFPHTQFQVVFFGVISQFYVIDVNWMVC